MAFNGVYDLPYDPTAQSKQSETPPLDVIIRLYVKSAMAKLRVSMPCTITKVLGNQKVNLQPNLQGRLTDGTLITLPELQNVPVWMPNGADYSIKLPIAVGDTGDAIFADRSLDAWLAGSGATVDPQDVRSHDISDAVFYPGLVPFSKQTTDATTDLVVTNGKAQLKVQKAGTFVFTNMTNELMDLLDQTEEQLFMLADTLSTDTVNTIFGPMQLNAFQTYAEIANAVQTIKTKLDTLKGM